MSQTMFEQLLEKPRSMKKWLFVPLSLLVHGFAAVAIIVSPLLSTAVELPELRISTVSLAAPSPPPLLRNEGGRGRQRIIVCFPVSPKKQEPLWISVRTPPRLVKKIETHYPCTAKLAHVRGNIVIEAFTDIYGRVVKTNVICGHPLLRQAAVQAVMQWVYEPYMVNGIPKPVRFTVNVKFTLQR